MEPLVLWMGFDGVEVCSAGVDSRRTIDEHNLRNADLVVVDDARHREIPNTRAMKIVLTTDPTRTARADELLLRDQPVDGLLSALPVVAAFAQRARGAAESERSLLGRIAHELSNALTSLRLVSALLGEAEEPEGLASDLQECSHDLQVQLALLVGLVDDRPQRVRLSSIVRHATFASSHMVGRILSVQHVGLDDVEVYVVWPHVWRRIAADLTRMCGAGVSTVTAGALPSGPDHVVLRLSAASFDERITLRRRP